MSLLMHVVLDLNVICGAAAKLNLFVHVCMSEAPPRYNYGSRAPRGRMLKTVLQRHQLNTQKPNHFPPKVAFSIAQEQQVGIFCPEL